jgi:hypothetical protein
LAFQSVTQTSSTKHKHSILDSSVKKAIKEKLLFELLTSSSIIYHSKKILEKNIFGTSNSSNISGYKDKILIKESASIKILKV